MRKFGIVLIAACASFFCANGVQAQSKVTKKAKTAKVEKTKKPKGKKAEAAVAKVDTVPVSDFSYCMGMAQSEGFETTHEDAVGNDKSHEHRELFAHLVHIGFENLVYDNYQCGDDD